MPSSEIWAINPKETERWEASHEHDLAELPPVYEKRAAGSHWPLWVIPLLLSLSGIIMIASLTSRSGQISGLAFYWQAFRQFQFLLLGLMLMYFCCLVPLSLMRRLSWLLWVFALILTFATLFPSLGVRVGGARRWLAIFGLQFQPLEILTLAIPLFLADRLSVSKRENLEHFLRPTMLIAIISAAPLFFQPNMGGIILVFAICVSMHVVNRGWKYPLIGGAFLLLIFLFMIYSEEYRMRRLFAFLNPWDDPMNRGFQVIQGLVAFSNGGVFGVGVGRGLQTLNFLPAAHTDYIFPAIGEEFGLIGTLIIVLLYAFWTIKAYMIYRSTDDQYVSVLIWGLAASVLFPMIINLGGVMQLMPLTGIPLPFVSLGGTSIVIMWVRIGILLRIAREISMPAQAQQKAAPIRVVSPPRYVRQPSLWEHEGLPAPAQISRYSSGKRPPRRGRSWEI